jgi:hypothetical protein
VSDLDWIGCELYNLGSNWIFLLRIMDVDPGSRRLSLLRRPEEDDILVPRHGQELSGSGAVTVRPRTLCSCQAAAPTSNADSDGAKTAAALPTLSLEDAINEPKLHSAAVADDQVDGLVGDRSELHGADRSDVVQFEKREPRRGVAESPRKGREEGARGRSGQRRGCASACRCLPCSQN